MALTDYSLCSSLINPKSFWVNRSFHRVLCYSAKLQSRLHILRFSLPRSGRLLWFSLNEDEDHDPFKKTKRKRRSAQISFLILFLFFFVFLQIHVCMRKIGMLKIDKRLINGLIETTELCARRDVESTASWISLRWIFDFSCSLVSIHWVDIIRVCLASIAMARAVRNHVLKCWLIIALTVAFVSGKTHLHRVHRCSLFPTQLNLPRICCLILTTPKYFSTRAKAVNATWGPRCDKYYFISELHNENLTVHRSDQRYHPWLQSLEAEVGSWLYLRLLFLHGQNSSERVTFDYSLKVIVPKGYHSGGASYVLSRESLRRFHAAYTSANSSLRRCGDSELSSNERRVYR